MAIVFINYRRDETAGEARALFKELAEILGKDSVFMDVDTIALGHDFRQVIRERLESCDLMLALIGRDWVDSRNASGRRRLEDPTDFVRLEIEAALKRNIPITPVLVQGAQMPAVEQLPEDIRDFAYRNGFEVSHNRWESDVREMFKRLGLSKQPDTGAIHEIEAPGRKPPAESSSTPARRASAGVPIEQQRTRKPLFTIVSASVVAIALAGGGILYYRGVAEKNAKIEQALVESLKAKADAEAVAQAAADQAERERAMAQAERERAAAQAAAAKAERERAERERRAAAQAAAEAERRRIAEAEEARKRRVAAEAERKRMAEAEEERRRQAAAERERSSGAQTAKFSGSITVSVGAYARSAGLKQSELSIRNTQRVCSGWSRELPLSKEESAGFAISCGQLSDFANVNGWQLGTQPAPQDWMSYCREMANKARADFRSTFMRICLKYR